MENSNAEKEQDFNQSVEKNTTPTFAEETKSYFQIALGVIKGKEKPASLEKGSFMLLALIIMAIYSIIPSIITAFASARIMSFGLFESRFEFDTFVLSFVKSVLLYGLGLGGFVVAIFLAYKYTDNTKSWKEVLPQVAVVLPFVLVLLLLSFLFNSVGQISSPLSSIARVLPFLYFYYVLSEKKVDTRKLFIVSFVVFAACAFVFALLEKNPFVLRVFNISDLFKGLF